MPNRFFALTGALALGLAVAAPASARPEAGRSTATWNHIVQLERDVNRADARNTVSDREASAIRRDIAAVKQQYRRFSANGINSNEARMIDGRVAQIRQRLHHERRDRDGWRG